jgi:uncharacterized membrane-anchored protein
VRQHILFAAAVALQVTLLVGMGLRRSADVREGERILLRVVPVDPRDIFMGEHVVLGYEVSRLDAARVAMDFVPREGESFYLRLEPRGGWTPARLARVPGPHDGGAVWLRGTCRRISGSVLSAEYGIEKFYVAEGRGPEIEDAVRHGTVEAEIAVATDGTATLTALIVNGERVD